MRSRSELKKSAKSNLKKHYLLFVLLCVVAAFMGSEFSNSLSITKIDTTVVDSKINVNSKIKDEVEKTVKKVDTVNDNIKNSNKILETKRGVFAGIVNSVDSGSLYLTLLKSLRSIIGSSNISVFISIIISVILFSLFWFFIANTYKVISRRMFLEGRVYKKVPLKKFVFLLRVKKWWNASKTMFITFVYEFLWSLTIIGGFIKRYSYFLVPYILAENPTIKSRDAIKLSRDMMNGYKFKCFILELSFIWWRLLGIITLGISEIFFTDAYRSSTFCEFYADIRKISKDKNIKNSNLLCDKYLYEIAPFDLLEESYYDDIKNIKIEKINKKGIKGKIEDIFGINLSSAFQENEYEQNKVNEIKLKYILDEANGNVYPGRLYIIPEKKKRKRVEVVNYLRHYNISTLILMFFIFSTIGWLWEVSLHLIEDGTFVNRGVMHGPWLPIYGFGGVLVLVVLNKFREKPLLEFISIIILCGIVEYFTSFYLELTHNGVKWWDYSGYFLNLNGRICAEGLLVFGLGGIADVYFLSPLLDNLIRRINSKILIPLVSLLVIVFTIDQIYSSKNPNIGTGITDYKIDNMYIYNNKV